MSRLSELKVTGTVVGGFQTPRSPGQVGQSEGAHLRYRLFGGTMDLRKSAAKSHQPCQDRQDLRGKTVEEKAPPNIGPALRLGCLTTMGLFLLVVLALAFFPDTDSPQRSKAASTATLPTSEVENASEESKKSASLSWCQIYIKEHLRDPDSAEFIDPIGGQVAKINDGEYMHALTIRAANGFGGKTVATFLCTVRNRGEHRWQLLDLTQVN